MHCRYYPLEHKYISLFPSKEAIDKVNDSDEETTAEKSKQLSKKARETALQRWAEDRQKAAEAVEGVVDKVAHAMEVEYKGGAAGAAARPASASA